MKTAMEGEVGVQGGGEHRRRTGMARMMFAPGHEEHVIAHASLLFLRLPHNMIVLNQSNFFHQNEEHKYEDQQHWESQL